MRFVATRSIFNAFVATRLVVVLGLSVLTVASQREKQVCPSDEVTMLQMMLQAPSHSNASVSAGDIRSNVASRGSGSMLEVLKQGIIPASYVIVFIVFVAIIVFHEAVIVSKKGPILLLSLPAQTTHMQMVFFFAETVLAAEIRVVIPSSYAVAEKVGYGATLSALLISTPFIGAILGTFLSERLLQPYNQAFIRRTCVVFYLLSASLHLLSALLFKSSLTNHPTLAFWTFCCIRLTLGVLGAPPKIAADLGLSRITRKADQVMIAVISMTFTLAGACLGPGISSVAQSIPLRAKQSLSAYDQVAWPELATSLMMLLFCLVYGCVVPEELPESSDNIGHAAVSEQQDDSASAHSNAMLGTQGAEIKIEPLPDYLRERIVSYAIYSGAVRIMITVGLVGTTVLLLERQYGWSSIASGFAMACIAAWGIAIGLLHFAITAYELVSDSLLLTISSVSGLVGCCFMFNYPVFQNFGEYVLLLADAIVFAAAIVCNGIATGWARRSAKSGTSFSLKDLAIYETLFAILANILAPILTRALVEFGSRNCYVCWQLALALCNCIMNMVACSMYRSLVEQFAPQGITLMT